MPGPGNVHGPAALVQPDSDRMTTTAVTPERRPLVRHFVRRFVELLLSMVVGVLVLGPLWPLPETLAVRTDVASLMMATNMSVAAAVWMWHRGHSNAAIGE